MALHWDLTSIADYKSVCLQPHGYDDPASGLKADDVVLRPTTERLIWATMAVGMGRIRNETDAAEFYLRLRLVAKLDGAYENVTYDQVKAHIGLSTNVTTEPRSKWIKRKVDYFEHEVKRELKND